MAETKHLGARGFVVASLALAALIIGTWIIMDDQSFIPQARGPVAKRLESSVTVHGRTRNDPYAWMKDEAWQDVMRDPSVLREDIRRHLEAENGYVEAVLGETQSLQDLLFAEMKARIKKDDATVPSADGAFAYYRKFKTGGQYPIFARAAFEPQRREVIGPEEVLVDGDALAEGAAYFAFATVAHSPDHQWLGYATDTQGSEFYDIRFRDAKTGQDAPDVLERTYGEFVWAADSKTIFYVWRDDNNRPSRIYRHVLGEDPAQDVLVYEESDPGFFLSLGVTESRRFIVLSANDHTTSEHRVIPADAPQTAPRLIAARERDVEYDLTDFDGQFVIRTNADGAKDFKLMRAPYSASSRSDWRDFTPHQPGVLIEGMLAYKDFLVREELVNAKPRLIVRDRASGTEHEVAFLESAYELAAIPGYEFNSANLRFDYSSPSTPNQVWDYDMAARSRLLRKTREIPSGHDPNEYIVERIEAIAEDGAQVPVTILRRTDMMLDGTAPALLGGYGSYGATIPTGFRSNWLSLADRGWVVAWAHIRGGKDKGYDWYLDGKRDKKQNTFKDFVAAGEALVAKKYVQRGRIVAQGGSAGGLLVGAAVNRAPELFAGVIAAVPFVDVINTMSDASLPLTPPEWPEWGNPLESAEQYEWIAAYSPYDNVAERPYPPIFATAGLSDPRVTYWEPAKWIARLRHDAPKAGPYFLKTNMDAGHGGASGRFNRLRETAQEYAFAIWAMERRPVQASEPAR